MLSDLQVKNFALIDQVNINFKKGLNILSGETGAGKSIIIGALDLLLGARANTDVIRTAKDAAYISAFFQPSELEIINNILDEAGVEKEQNGILIAREIKENGRNRTLINGQLATLRMVKKISRYLIDIHGQHEHQLLLDQSSHLMILDAFIGSEIKELKNDIKDNYAKYQVLKRELAEIDIDDSERVRELDILNFQIDEIEKANLQIGEYQSLKEKYQSLSHGEEIYQNTSEVLNALSGDDYSEQGLLDRMAILKSKLESLKEYNKKLAELNQNFADIYYNLEEFIFELGDYCSSFNYDEEELALTADRLDLLNSLFRKYGDGVEEILEYLAELQEKRKKLENIEEKIAQIKQEKNELKNILLKKAEKLSELRKKQAGEFEAKLKAELQDLAMEDVKFELSFQKKDLGESGIDRVEFLISPNKGEELRPLTKIASGGEISRIMLALKTITAGLDQVDTLIFDEVDSGVGGETAARMAEKLAYISKDRQIICITHLPQIATAGSHHYLIKKEKGKNRTYTHIYALDEQQRIEEIARMIGGTKMTDKTIAHAKEMLDMAAEELYS
ncbi:DNA repair protein RecN [Halanaerobium hydrogeniformans]|uniref:DNA repair protein RecN n=1 Tax=Halanaerobium hydrogeniformans TaxID=656519 RepID=E4RL49_HALHG|nr:DNA repair protein RecN [Halanaerobium hydrogeniformans]ADQ14813.1 DNA repair protein RecN [Halanaerobium hydrogeniformans]